MKAIIIEKYGKNPVKLANIETPNITENEVLVEIHAASINPIDNKIKAGKLKILLKYKMPLIMGNDFAGIIVKTGKNIKYFKIGDKVYGRPRKSKIGTFAEFIAINENDIALMPKNLTFEQSASIPLVGLTSYQALNNILNMKKDQKILIQAGSGGIGSFAIQLAKYMGLYVATTTSDKNIELVKKLGANKIINYKNEKFNEILKNYDAVFDTLGNQAVKDAFKIIKQNGHIVSITANPNKQFISNYKNSYKFNILQKIIFKIAGMQFDKLEKKYNAKYSFLFMWSSRDQLNIITKLIENHKIIPIINKIFTLEDTQKALAYSATNRTVGKIVIKIK